jgi:hypothetical protein
MTMARTSAAPLLSRRAAAPLAWRAAVLGCLQVKVDRRLDVTEETREQVRAAYLDCAISGFGRTA